jgi:Na+/H+-dicarboxylate symporter
MIVVPLIACSIIQGMIGLGSDKNFGRMGIKTLLYYMSTGLVAICVGILLVNIIQPGNIDPNVAEKLVVDAQEVQGTISGKVAGKSGNDFAQILVPNDPTQCF